MKTFVPVKATREEGSTRCSGEQLGRRLELRVSLALSTWFIVVLVLIPWCFVCSIHDGGAIEIANSSRETRCEGLGESQFSSGSVMSCREEGLESRIVARHKPFHSMSDGRFYLLLAKNEQEMVDAPVMGEAALAESNTTSKLNDPSNDFWIA
jgi:hypothetical protein